MGLKISESPEDNYEKYSEKIRIRDRRKAQKKGFSLATKKSKTPEKKPIREHRKVTKKRSAIR